MVREIETIRDRIMMMCGTSEPLIEADDFPPGHVRVTMQWRKPLSVVEVNQMAKYSRPASEGDDHFERLQADDLRQIDDFASSVIDSVIATRSCC